MDRISSLPPAPDAAPTPSPPPPPPPADWRAIVASTTHKRRQTPTQQRATVQRILSRTDAPHPIHLPRVTQAALRHKSAVQADLTRGGASTPTSLRKTLRHDFAESKEQLHASQPLNPTALFHYAVQRAEHSDPADRPDPSAPG